MRPLAGPWLSVSISPALRSGHKGHALGPFTATAQMLGSICYGWGQRSPVNFWFHSIHQLYGHGASYTCRGSRGDTAHLTAWLAPFTLLLIGGQRIPRLLHHLKTNYQEDRDVVSDEGKVTGWMNDEMNTEIWTIDDFETDVRTETETSFLVKLNIVYVYVGNYRVQTCTRWLFRLLWYLCPETVNSFHNFLSIPIRNSEEWKKNVHKPSFGSLFGHPGV